MANNIETLMETMGTPTLKAIAGVFDLNPVRLYSVAKQPKEGEVYDAHVYNWDAIERFIKRRLDPDKGLATVEDVLQRALEIDVTLKDNDGRRRGNRGEGTGYGAKIEVDGKMVAKRRFGNFEMEKGQPICLKKDPEVYAIVLQTASHTVIRPINEDNTFKGNEVKVISNFMLNMRGIGPSALEDAVKDRFSGVYAQKMAEEAQKVADEAAAKVPTTE